MKKNSKKQELTNENETSKAGIKKISVNKMTTVKGGRRGRPSNWS